MNSDVWLLIFVQVILIGLNAVFAGAEIAIISFNDQKMQLMAKQGNKRALRLAILTSQPARFLATIQVAITLSGFLGSAFAAENFSDLIVNWILSLGVQLPFETLNTLAVIIITLVLSYFTLVFGELVPKRLAMKKAESLALGVSGLITIISKVFSPLVSILTLSTNAILRILGIDPEAKDEEVGEEEIQMMVDAGSENGNIDLTEREFIHNVFAFDDLTAQELVTHRMNLVVLLSDNTLEEWDEIINNSRFNLYPICSDSIEHIVGVLDTKEYFRLKTKTKEEVLKKAVKPGYYVPATLKADVLFKNLKETHNQMAIVMDEYGGVKGIVTMHDLIERLVGKIDAGE